jgi:hypothetical protein
MCERGKENERGLRTPLSGVAIKDIEEKTASIMHMQQSNANNTNVCKYFPQTLYFSTR